MATERALPEAEKMALVPGVEFVMNPAGRRPRLIGDLEIWEVIDNYQQCGDQREAFHELFPHLTEQQIDTALAHYHRFPEEIDAWIEHNYSWTPEDIDRLNEELGVTTRSRTASTLRDAQPKTEQ